MKSRLYYKAVSATVSAAILAASLQFANPVDVYAGEEISQTDIDTNSLETETGESVPDDAETETGEPVSYETEIVAADGSDEGQVTEPNFGTEENQEPYQAPSQEPNQEINIETPTDEPVSEDLVAESTLSGGVAQENADIENSKTDKAATGEDIFSEAELVTLELEEVSLSEESTAKEDESETLSDEKSEKEDLTEGASNQEMDSDAIGERTVLGEASGEVSNDITVGDNSETHYPYNQYAVEGYGATNENRGASVTLDVVLGNGIRFILSGVNDFIVNRVIKLLF